ncbi:MAG: hypothetical protein B6D65_03695 [candidate division Zixibacteria bacterium 4484_93]|nr:MAG: hypothetical protein B6D65_03695 [candidate division Zixibacteria bacterium 4484_93]RKZ33083.1 MAG: hypothetical protein DRQ19_03280 [bacterium]
MKFRSMLIELAVFLVPAILFSQAENQPQTISGPQPKIEVPETSFDFGYAPSGHYLLHSYILRNIGEDTLHIKRVRTTCGCTKSPLVKQVIAPGDSTYVTLIFNSTRYYHKVRKAAYITSDDPQNPRVKIDFTADMDTLAKPIIRSDPAALDFGSKDDFKTEKSFHIIKDTKEKLDLTIVDYTKDVIKEIKIDKKWKKNKREVTLTLSDDINPQLFFKGSVTFEASDSLGTRITVPVRGGGAR